MLYPKLTAPTRTQFTRTVFGGLERGEQAQEGAFTAMENLSADCYPLLSTRGARGVCAQLTDAQGLAAKKALAYVDGGTLYYAGRATGLTLSQLSAMRPKTLVGMGAYIVVFPDKCYFNTEDETDFGSLENRVTLACAATPLRLRACRSDGTPYESVTASETQPPDPTDGAMWFDTRADTRGLYRYSAATLCWTGVAATYIRLEASGIGAGFAEGDGVELSGVTVAALSGGNVIEALGDDFVVVTGLLEAPCTQDAGTVTLARTVPDMDFVTECGNRLWGCRYGLADGKTVNEIYACALGDFRNWNRFRGLASDSYRASRGSDGAFTGAITYLGSPLFFKENCLERVYPSASGAHQITTLACRGVHAGCAGSLAIVGEKLYYVSADCVCAYDGSLPVSVSAALGAFRAEAACGGALGGKYCLSACEDGAWSLYVYDTRTALWHREDALHARFFAARGAELYCIDDASRLLALRGSEGTAETPLRWYAESARIGTRTADNKYVTRLQLRFRLDEGGEFTVFVRYDGGDWENKGTVRATTLQPRAVTIPILPRRCDHFAVRLAGTGGFRLHAVTKLLEAGSDVYA